MSKVVFDICISLDGFITGPDQTADEPLGRGGMQLHEWATGLDTGCVYGRKLTARDIVTGKGITVPASGRHFVAVLEKNARRNESTQSTKR